MKNKLFFWSILFSLFINSVVWAYWKKPEFRWQQLYRYELNRNKHRLYTNRFSATFNYLNKEVNPLFKITPFFEIRRNIAKDLWERKELGVELGKEILPWLYVGEVIQMGWMKEDYRYYMDYERRDYAESETRLLLSHNLLSNKYISLRGFVLNEYAYDFERETAARNEVVAGLIIPIGKHIETTINWRHIDRISYYDSDTFEASLTLIF